jgi:hypothetical protein
MFRHWRSPEKSGLDWAESPETPRRNREAVKVSVVEGKRNMLSLRKIGTPCGW